MRPHWFLFALAAAALGTGGARAQKVQSPADLFPAKTLVYAEVRKPGPLAKEVRALFAGSVLGNVPASLAGLREKLLKAGAPPWQVQPLGAFGLALSPEVVKEVGRLKGAAVGLMGIDKRGEPEFLAVVLPGGSQAPAFFMRTLLTMAPVRVVGKVQGVPLYQMEVRRFQRVARPPGEKGGPPPVPEIRPFGPAYAMMPGALFIGTRGAVTEAIHRAKGKAEGEALAKSAAFQEASKDAGGEPGLFAFANVAQLADFIQHQEKFAKGAAEFVKLLNPKAFRSVAYSLTLSKGTLRYREMARLDPKEKSPLLEALPAAPVNTELLHFAPRGATMVAALSNADGEKRWPRVLHILDTFARLSGEKGLPSQHLKKMEEALQINFARDVAGKISNVGVAVGDLWNAPVRKVVRKGPGFESVSVSPQVPLVVIVQATDEAAAQKMTEECLPHAVALMARRKGVKPAVKEVGGQKVYSMKLGPHEGLHYGRHGNTIVLGPYERPVAQALAAGAEKKGWLANAKMAAALKKVKEPVLVAVVKPASLVVANFFMGGSQSKRSVTRTADKAVGPDKAPPPQPEGKITETVEKGPALLGKEGARLRKELAKLLANEEPLVLSVTRTEDRIQGEATVSGLRPLVSRLTDYFIIGRMMRGRMEQRQGAKKPRIEFKKKEK